MVCFGLAHEDTTYQPYPSVELSVKLPDLVLNALVDELSAPLLEDQSLHVEIALFPLQCLDPAISACLGILLSYHRRTHELCRAQYDHICEKYRELLQLPPMNEPLLALPLKLVSPKWLLSSSELQLAFSTNRHSTKHNLNRSFWFLIRHIYYEVCYKEINRLNDYMMISIALFICNGAGCFIMPVPDII